jgi:hypothetical protein
MKLTQKQQDELRQWATEGLSLGEIQDRLRNQDVHLTYMEARLLMIELSVSLAEDAPEPEKPAPADDAPAATQPAGSGQDDGLDGEEFDDDEMPAPGNSSVKVDPDVITLPGAVASGKVTFSDGKVATWHVDGSGRLAVQPPEPGYQPPPADVPEFQRQLALEFRRMGY